MKILNLYAGIGGNRRLWPTDVEVTAIEYKEDIASVYKELYPEDKVIVADAHQYLLENYKEYDFIWSSPPCPSHSQYRYNVGVIGKGFEAVYPDMSLYEEILLLKHYFKGKWVVENVKPYYSPLIKPTAILSRHYFWSNFPIKEFNTPKANIRSRNKISELEEYLDIYISKYKLKDKRQILRNCVYPTLGLHIYKSAYPE